MASAVVGLLALGMTIPRGGTALQPTLRTTLDASWADDQWGDVAKEEAIPTAWLSENL